MTKKLEEVEVRINALTKNIKSLKNKMIDSVSERKYRYHLEKLKEAKKRLLEIAQNPNKTHPIK